MATVIFYEKPGCINNTNQKQLLTAAGHQVIARSLLTENWQPDELRTFFGQLPVNAWFNLSAPAIKEGLVQPNKLSEQAALALMLENPILIRRPLMQVGGECRVGFDPTLVHNWIGLAAAMPDADLETCPRTVKELEQP